MDSFIGEIRILPYTFAPEYWAYCNGMQLLITQNQALYAVIGATYGGDLRNYFNLPNMARPSAVQGYVPIGMGQGPGLTPRNQSQNGFGDDSVALALTQIPSHNHSLNAQTTTTPADYISDPSNAYIGRGYAKDTGAAFFSFAAYNATTATTLRSDALDPAGAYPDVAHSNKQPYLTMNFCISLAGEYPVRS
jgi:microcystin-dependent protein